MKKRVIELIRVSTESQAASDRASIPAQRAINRRTETAYNLEIVRSIEISDVSGAAVLFAPEIQELLKLMADPCVHGVVTREFSRLMRPENFSDYALLQAFADTNTLLYLPDGPIDFGSKSGRLIGVIRAAIAGNERSEILERAWAAKEEKRKAGKFAQSRVCLPFGVDYSEAAGFSYTADAEKVREAFKHFLSGETSYYSVGKKLGIHPYSLRIILRNPIYTGWRVIDKKRDTSARGRRVKKDGRQADRPKIKRAADEVIRVKVIDEGLITEAEFERVQQVMDLKKARHWRTGHGKYPNPRFTYNGFLDCAKCGNLVYTAFRKNYYYICKSRYCKSSECHSVSMRREILEPALDKMFQTRLTDEGFLRRVAAEAGRAPEASDADATRERLESKIESLKAKRERVMDAYFDGAIDQLERSARLEAIDKEMRLAEEMLFKTLAPEPLSADLLAQVFEPFFEWEFLSRDDKRRLLAAIVPQIKVADYRVESIALSLPALGEEMARKGMGHFVAESRPLILPVNLHLIN